MSPTPRKLGIPTFMHYFSTILKARLLFYLFFYLFRSQATTSSPLAAGSADLIQHFQTSRTPCCLFSLLHSQMAAEEAPGTLGSHGLIGWILRYNMYLQNPTDSPLFCLFCSCVCPLPHPEFTLTRCAGTFIHVFVVSIPLKDKMLYRSSHN